MEDPAASIGTNENDNSIATMSKYSSVSSSDADGEKVPLNVVSIAPLHGQDGEEKFSCKLCLEDDFSQQDMFKLQTCSCEFCLKCLQSYVEVLINDGVVLVLSCPDADCPIAGKLQQSEIRSLCSEDTFEKYKRLKFEQEVAIDPLRTFCPGASCSAVCELATKEKPNSGDRKSDGISTATVSESSQVTCSKCQLVFCNICKSEWKPDHRCNEFSFSFSTEFQRLQSKAGLNLNDSNIKRCPFCNILIEKDRGCAQMICKNCSHVFCWYCLKLLDNDFMLRHYDKGPCRNMLGHSRAQVYRHRIGVVGLFAAFSLLIVVASPVLLLAAPVILCCKCKEGCQQAINRFNQHNREGNILPMEERRPQAAVTEEPTSSNFTKPPTPNLNDVELGLKSQP